MESFSAEFQDDLLQLMRWRRDVRRFRTDPVDEALLLQCLEAFSLAPSVGLSEPWRILRVQSSAARAAALHNFQSANQAALGGQSGNQAKEYSKLKLSGMTDAPVQLAVFCDETTLKGKGLGTATMPEMRRYSVVGAVNHLWLAARARGLGVGWVSILDPQQLRNDLKAPENWTLVAYLCIGWPQTTGTVPELELMDWETRRTGIPVETR